MGCCQCNGSCNHIGPHAMCVAHGGPTFGGVITTTHTIGPLDFAPAEYVGKHRRKDP